MYIPATFRETRIDVLHALIRRHSFGTLVSQVGDEPFATHIPFLLEPERGPYGTLVGHVARANPHWRTFVEDQPQTALATFLGPHAYISPRWYLTTPNVPTWNYTAVHAYGTPLIVDDARRVREILETTIRTFEGTSDSAWTIADLPAGYVEQLSRAIVAFEMPILRLEGKRKLGQNRAPEDARGAIDGLRAQADPSGRAVAEMMLEVAAADVI